MNLIPKSFYPKKEEIWTFSNTKDIQIGFGKYKGDTLHNICSTLRGCEYLIWLAGALSSEDENDFFYQQLDGFLESSEFREIYERKSFQAQADTYSFYPDSDYDERYEIDDIH